jgi:hypothetical protein
MTGAARHRGRVLWAAASQVMSSATNFTLYAALLLWADADDFGRLVALLACSQLALAVSRALASEPMVAAAAPLPPRGRDGGSALFTWAWCRRRLGGLGLAAASGVVVVGWLVGAEPTVVLVLAPALPVVLRQDGQRNLCWALGRPRLAVTLDGVWLAVTGTMLAGLVVGGFHRPLPVVVAWALGGLASGLVGRVLIERRAAPPARSGDGSPTADRPAEPGATLDDRRLHARRRSHALLTSARNLLPIVVATLVSPAAAGLLKAGVMPFAPILSLVAGLRPVVLPAMQRAAEREASGEGGFERFVARLLALYATAAGGAVALTVLVGSVVVDRFDVPPSISRGSLLWGGAIALTTVLSVVLADAIGFGRRAVPPITCRLGEIAVEWTTVLAVSMLIGPHRAVAGWAVGQALGALVWLAPSLAGPQRPDPAPGSPAPAPPGPESRIPRRARSA